MKGVTSWRKGGEAKGWKNAKGQPVANADHWRTLFQLSDHTLGSASSGSEAMRARKGIRWSIPSPGLKLRRSVLGCPL